MEFQMMSRHESVSLIAQWARDGASVDELAYIVSLFWDSSDTGVVDGVCVVDGLRNEVSQPYCNGEPVVAESA